MPSNAALIHQFYTAFAAGDAAGMLACYADNVVFEDPAFGMLRGERAKNMWRMLLSRGGSELRVSYGEVATTGDRGSASWRAEYFYGPKRRKVVNEIHASFVFQDGKIIRHTDVFDLWKWSRQALGLPGWLVGWSPMLRRKIRASTGRLLDGFAGGE
ncbi:nuclear transport factor 2 family protein [Neolewinella lacunae]|uniref:Nuclear transport factor 2 family protein n=1 Tax=Neolewinella lacunae TaxID=1517758 RepID=A0A923PMR5_9BACT|nr:nuclear transport factor 2 family protein [Neolewinella lacunae]MBC6995571.1 nuclear transport factor 2 family protein [Neolewinella lacunae]MDN3635607.1 nuclear transport factor 2 family protein [Neolewinella lacunae]